MSLVTLLDTMGTDLSVVNAARVSFAKKSDYLPSGQLSPQDIKLLNYLARHNHWSPFAHTCLSFHISAPIFVARQLAKHQVGLAWNEVSRRYVSSSPTFFTPEEWRKAAKDKKQGSSSEKVASPTVAEKYEKLLAAAYAFYMDAVNIYEVAPEQARMILPQSAITEWIWTGSLYAFFRVCSLRIKPDAQEETKTIAEEIANHSSTMFPNSWKALMSTMSSESTD